MPKLTNLIKEKLKTILSEKQNSESQLERNVGILYSLKIVINVLYALMIFQVFLILPRSDDEELTRYTLAEVFSIHAMELIVVCVGLIMIITYWIQFNRQLGNLVRSSRFHGVLALLQMIFLMIYLYFMRLDLETDGTTFALQMESVFLALAGFIAAINWYYAKKNNLTSEKIGEEEKRVVLLKILPEPIAATFSLPFASLGPMAWSISFLVIIPLEFIFNKMVKKS
jgi:hypothetical protein